MGEALDRFRASAVQQAVVEGLPLRYRVIGQGPPVLFVHGWPLCAATYREVACALRDEFRCIMIDLPGAGETPWSPAIKESMMGIARLLHGFVDAIGLDRLAMVGHDSGGGIARVLAAELGPRVTALVLQNTELPNDVPAYVRFLRLNARVAPSLVGTLLKNRAFRRSVLGFGATFHDRSLIDGDFHAACIEPLLQNPSGATSMLARIDFRLVEQLDDIHARISAPIHLFWGGSDFYFPLTRARAMFARLPTAGEMEVIPGAKLFVHEEHAARLAEFSRRHLRAAFAADSSRSGTRSASTDSGSSPLREHPTSTDSPS